MRGKTLLCIWLSSLTIAFGATALSATDRDLRLLQAVKRGDRTAVSTLLQQHINVNARAGDGATALAWAAYRGDQEIAGRLLQASADVNAANDYGATPLWLACSRANAAMVEELLSGRADPNLALLSGETPLMTATATGSLEVVKLLLAHGANVNAKEPKEGQTALMWAVAETHPDIVQVLIEHGGNVNARTSGGFTPLLFAAQQGDVDSARLLIQAGANVNEGLHVSSQSSATPLLIAAASGHADLSSFLLEKGADPNAVDDRGLTALHYAAAKRDMLGAVKSLLSRGANPNARIMNDLNSMYGNPEGDRTLAPGTFGKFSLGVTEMSTKGATPLFMAAIAGNSAAIRLLTAAGADPRLGTERNTTPLMVAAGVGLFETRRAGAEQPALETVKLLIELGSDVNAAGEHKWTALHGAAYSAQNQIIQLLVEKGAKLDVMDEYGQTPLSIAASVVTEGITKDAYKRGRAFKKDTVELLLKLGATPVAASGVKGLAEGVLPEGFSAVTSPPEQK